MPGHEDDTSEKNFRYLMDAAPVMVWVTGTDKLCTFFNQPWLTFTGRTMEQELGNGWAEGIHPDDLACLEIGFGHFDRREPFQLDYRMRRADGEYRWILDSGVPRFAMDGTFLGYIGSCIDITDRKRAEAEARESERRYREVQMELAHANRVATMGQLTASIAHEVNQPIGALVTNAQAALRLLSAPRVELDTVRQIANDIVKDGNRASEIISRVRDLIKKAPPRRDHWEINAAIREVIELTRGEAVKSHVSVQTELADGLLFIQGDRVQLQQVILNLIINAVEAMSGTSEDARELHISSGKANWGSVLVSVRDSGPRLAPASFDRLFDPFYTTKPSGLGMGLTICRSIIEAHGGRLWASANVPSGAIFEFTLPAQPDSQS
ncbi:ATP-binding protein [Bradyrhizobium sp. AS23.2]|uniref:sensor histidine kinase n=1 Tax=Bradyrhizobium sp. AS23.2 TaxID=1680155 RepID=UPI001161515A|nr:ATP-binding protein [Bradyrhizobium sp. AS23.2]